MGAVVMVPDEPVNTASISTGPSSATVLVTAQVSAGVATPAVALLVEIGQVMLLPDCVTAAAGTVANDPVVPSRYSKVALLYPDEAAACSVAVVEVWDPVAGDTTAPAEPIPNT